MFKRVFVIVSGPVGNPESSSVQRRSPESIKHSPNSWACPCPPESGICLDILFPVIRCGATLVHSSSEVTLMVTAAHCASLPLRGLSLVCSGQELLIDPESGIQSFRDGYLLNIISIKTHEKYDDRRYINDIALIFAEVK